MHWRKATWTLVIWTALFAFLTFGGLASTPTPTTAQCGVLDQSTCQAAVNVGVGIGVTMLFSAWFIGFVILSIVWFMSRPRYVEYQGQFIKESEARKLSKQRQQEQH